MALQNTTRKQAASKKQKSRVSTHDMIHHAHFPKQRPNAMVRIGLVKQGSCNQHHSAQRPRAVTLYSQLWIYFRRCETKIEQQQRQRNSMLPYRCANLHRQPDSTLQRRAVRRLNTGHGPKTTIILLRAPVVPFLCLPYHVTLYRYFSFNVSQDVHNSVQ